MKISLLFQGLFLLSLLLLPVITDSFGLSVTGTGITPSVDSSTSVANTTVNTMISSNITSTSGTVSTSSPANALLPSNNIATGASSSIDGVQVFGNGTIITSVNGTQMSFYFDPKGPSSSVTLTIQSSDISGNLFSGMYVELYSESKIISHGYTPVSFKVSPGTQYTTCVTNYQNIVFDHWDDGSKNACRSFTLTQSSSFIAYYSTGSAPPTVPSPPSSLSATAVSSSQINLSWITPSNNGGSTITGYKIERSFDGGSTWSTLVSSTGTTNTSYSDMSVTGGITYAYRVSAINSIGTSFPSNTASATTPIGPASNTTSSSVRLIQSGNRGYDPLNNQTETQQQLVANQKYWKYDGSAVAEKAPYAFNEDLQGLHIGVQAVSSGKWAGFFAVSPSTQAMLFHSIVSQPVRTVSSDSYENGLYVQTSNGKINYVTCVALTNNQATVWALVNTYGDTNQATKFNVLWLDNNPNQPLTRDCTIITNGQNYLKVYLDNILVYTSNTLNLQMPAPYNTYLEPETSYSGQMLSGTYTYYYATADENIMVINNPENAATVKIVNASGQVLASSPVSSGSAKLDVGKYDFPLNAAINVYDSNNNVIASGQAKIFGGDVYSGS